MRKTYLDIELADGRLIEQVRVVAADKVTASRIARMGGIPLTDSAEIAELLAYAATTRTGLVTAASLDEWRPQVTDYAASETEPAADPTQPSREASSTR